MKFPVRLALILSLMLGSVWAQTTTLNLSQDLVRLGIASANMTPNQPTLDSGPLVENGVKYAASHQMTRVITDPGAYYFLSVSPTNALGCVTINNVTTPMTIDFQGSDLYCGHTEKVGMVLSNLTGVTVQNFTIDFTQESFIQVKINAVNAAARQLTIASQPGYQSPTAFATAMNTALNSGGNANIFVFRNGVSLGGGATSFAVAQPWTDTTLTLASSVTTTAISAFQPGDVAVLFYRTGTTQPGAGMQTFNLTNCTLQNIKIYAGVVGLRTNNTSGTLMQRVYVEPRPGTDRLVGSTAGGIVPAQSGAGNTIRYCRVIRNCDDAYAPNSFLWGSVQSVTGANTLQLSGADSVSLAINTFVVPNGTVVTFEATDGTILGTGTVTAQAAAPALNGAKQVLLTFAAPLPAGITGAYVCTPPELNSNGFLLERSTAQQQAWGRGIAIWGLGNMTAYGNYLYNTPWAGVILLNQLNSNDWIVGPCVNTVVMNNVIDGANRLPTSTSFYISDGGIETITYGPSLNTKPTHQNTSIVGNFVANSTSAGIWAGNANGGVVDSNYILDANSSPAVALQPLAAFKPLLSQPFVMESSQSVTTGSNPIDNVSGRIFVTDTNYAQLAAYAPGSTIRLSGLQIGALASPAIAITDADKSTAALTASASGTNFVDVALPANLALGGAVITLTSGNAQYFGTLFVDSQDNVAAINQATFQIAPGATTVPAAGGPVSFLVVTQPGTAVTISDADAFVSAGAGVTGTGVVTATFAANSGAARTTTVLVAQQPITITQAGASDPVITTPPQSQALASGAAATLSVQATNAKSYQWFLNGTPIIGATNSTYGIANATGANAGTYTVAVTGATSSAVATSAGALVAVANPPLPSRLANLSILTNVTSDTPTFTLGTVIGGAGSAGPKALLIRGAGPALAALGVGGTLSDPKLDVFSGPSLTASNDNWGGTATLTTAFAAVGAFGYPAATSKDAAVFNPALATGGYTVQVSGVGGATGTVIAELYDSTPTSQFTALTPRLINVSVLKQINAGETLTAGFVISGATSKQVLIRAVGATLGTAPFNIPGVMADPKLDLFSGQTVIATNDNWGTPVGTGAANATQLTAVFAQVGAFALNAGSKDAALLVTLAPGNYTAQVSGVNTTGGQALVEVYEVP